MQTGTGSGVQVIKALALLFCTVKTEADSSNFEHTVTKFSLGLFLPGVFK
ncbi:hypothetical protein ACQCVH_02205 [Bacillus infantis]